MVDIFALSLMHALLLVAVWRLLQSDELDAEVAEQSEELPGA
ncbi:MAG: hypothetical protein ABL912_07360 [Novosphingobium sp.]